MNMKAREPSSASQPRCREQYENLDEVQNQGQKAAHGGTNGTSELTINSQSTDDEQLHNYKDASHAPSKWLTVTRWLVGILLSAAFTFCLVFSKVGIIMLGQDLYRNRSVNVTTKLPLPTVGAEHPSTLDTNKSREATLAMIIVALLVPLVIRLVRALWSGGFSSDNPWPAGRALGAGILASILDSLGLALFVLGVVPNTSPSIGVALMNGVFFVHATLMFFPTLYLSSHLRGTVHQPKTSNTQDQTFKNLPQTSNNPPQASNNQDKRPYQNEILDQPWISQRCCLALTLALSVLLSVIIACYPCEGILRQRMAVWTIPVSLMCLSVAWCGPLHCIQSQKDVNGRSTRWKLTIITSLLRLVLLPGCLVALADKFYHDIDLTRLPAGFGYITPDNPLFPFCITTLVCSLAGYLLGWLAFEMSMEHLAFALPITVTTPIAFLLTIYMESCKADIFSGISNSPNCSLEMGCWYIVIPSMVCLYLAQLLSTGYNILKGSPTFMNKESQWFWMPGYNGAFLEQYMLLNRRTDHTDVTQTDRLTKARSPKVFICTTMYRETAHEMGQLLMSLGRINRTKRQSDRHFQAHIFFDNGVRSDRLTQFALQLVDIAGRILASEGLKLQACTKVPTPYGMQLRWVLGEKGMDFVIHLKDNLLIKSKKRWSQVMYMSYVLDFYIKEDSEATDNNTFILTTDGDEDFTPSSVEAALDHIIRNDRIGAVCTRTHPAGSGPVVWYQLFDYAIAHWFEKTTNHMLGTILICPGCFCLYRAEALRQVLPTYASSVTHASEFLTKDMGEDRWLSTLLIQRGWSLEYSASADNYSYCPDEFDEFFKQRRRWIPSKLANIVLLVQEWKTVHSSNSNISLLLFFYQAILLFSTLISPAVCMMVVSSGVHYVWGVSKYITVTLMYITWCGYGAVCLATSPHMQLKVSKVLTALGAIMMFAVTVGTAVQGVNEYQAVSNPALHTNSTIQASAMGLVPMPMSLTSLYLVVVVLLFVVAALLHLPEAYCLLHGVWYLWCLPASYIILITYSIVNLNDRSWGTREETTALTAGKSGTSRILQQLQKCLNHCFLVYEAREKTGTQAYLSMGGEDEERSDDTRNCTMDDSKCTTPMSADRPHSQVSAELELLPTGYLGDRESTFWADLRQEKLLPTSSASSDDHELKEKLSGLRNSVLVVFGVINTVWIILILVQKGQFHMIVTNTLGLFSLIVFGTQFVAMLKHRLSTFVHLIAGVAPSSDAPT